MNRLTRALRRLTDVRGHLREEEQRQARMLAEIQLSLLFLLVVGLVTAVFADASQAARQNAYTWLIVGLTVLVTGAFIMNRAGHQTGAARLTVAAAVAAPWASVLIDPAVLRGDLMPLAYVVFSIMLSALLLTARVTSGLAVVQWFALLFLAVFGPQTVFNWASLLVLVFFVSVVAVLYNSVRQRQLELISDQAIRDHLTSLFNRRYLEDSFVRELERARRAHSPVGIILADVDHFKRLNDTLGHAAGDELLQELGALMAAEVRAGDIASRFGGDEFILILPEAGLDAVVERAESIVTGVRNLDHEGTSVTVSVGVSVFPDHGGTVAELLESADDALYAAKAGGRDRFAVATTGPAT